MHICNGYKLYRMESGFPNRFGIINLYLRPGQLDPEHHASDYLDHGFFTRGGSHASRKRGGARSKIGPPSSEKRVSDYIG